MVDTDVASFVFKWHPVFAPQYVNIVRGFELVVCFMTVAETVSYTHLDVYKRQGPNRARLLRISM